MTTLVDTAAVADVVRTALLAGVSRLALDGVEGAPLDEGIHILELHCPDLIEPLTISAVPLGAPQAGFVTARLAPLDEAHADRLRGFLAFTGDDTDGMFGRVLGGRYRVERLLGRGAMGNVYRAHHLTLDKVVAVKVLHDRLRQDLTFSARFQREARAASRLDHPGILRVLDFGDDATSGVLYMVMELVEGRTLEQILSRGAIPLVNAVEIVARVGEALAVAHANGVVHRDIKAENVMISGDRVVVCDFGIATVANSTSLTLAGDVCGTPDYMAPEQARGEAVGPAADVYACGVLLFRLLTASLPFTRSTPLATAIAHLTDPIPAATALRADLDPRVDLLLGKLLAKDPRERPQDGAALGALLRRFGRVTTIPPRDGRVAPSSAPSSSPVPSSAPSSSPVPSSAPSSAPPHSRTLERSDVRRALLESLIRGDSMARIQALSGLRRLRAIDAALVPRIAEILDLRSGHDDEVRAAAATALGDAQPDAERAAIGALVGALAPRGETLEANLVVETVARALIDLAGEEGRRMVLARADHARGTLQSRLRSIAATSVRAMA